MIKGGFHLHDNAPSHRSEIVTAAAGRCGFQALSHTAWSPDSTLSELFLLPAWKRELKETKCEDEKHFPGATDAWLEAQPH